MRLVASVSVLALCGIELSSVGCTPDNRFDRHQKAVVERDPPSVSQPMSAEDAASELGVPDDQRDEFFASVGATLSRLDFPIQVVVAAAAASAEPVVLNDVIEPYGFHLAYGASRIITLTTPRGETRSYTYDRLTNGLTERITPPSGDDGADGSESGAESGDSGKDPDPGTDGGGGDGGSFPDPGTDGGDSDVGGRGGVR